MNGMMPKSIVATGLNNNPPASNSAGRRLATSPQKPQLQPWAGARLSRVQRDVSLVCRLGDRPVLEAFAEIARKHNLSDEIAELLGQFATLDPDHIALGNGDRFAPHPLMVVPAWMRES